MSKKDLKKEGTEILSQAEIDNLLKAITSSSKDYEQSPKIVQTQFSVDQEVWYVVNDSFEFISRPRDLTNKPLRPFQKGKIVRISIDINANGVWVNYRLAFDDRDYFEDVAEENIFPDLDCLEKTLKRHMKFERKRLEESKIGEQNG